MAYAIISLSSVGPAQHALSAGLGAINPKTLTRARLVPRTRFNAPGIFRRIFPAGEARFRTTASGTVSGTLETHQPKTRIIPNVYAGRRHFHLNIQFKRFSNDDEILD